MLKYKIDVGDELEKAGINMYIAKTTKILSQDTKKNKNWDTNIALESLNRICAILNMQPEDLILYEDNEEENCKCKKCNNLFQYTGSQVLKYQNVGCPDCREKIKTEQRIIKANSYSIFRMLSSCMIMEVQ